MRKIVIPVVFTVLLVAAMLHQAKTVDPVVCEAPDVKLGEIAGFVSEEIPVSEAELHTLPDDTRFTKRLYTAPDGSWFQVSVVIGGKHKSSIHRPEMCLPSQGFQMMHPRSADVGGIDWHLVTLARKESPSLGFAYTFYNQDGFRTSSHVQRIFCDVWDRSVRGRIDRWVMVTVNASTPNDAILSAFLLRLKGMAVR